MNMYVDIDMYIDIDDFVTYKNTLIFFRTPTIPALGFPGRLVFHHALLALFGDLSSPSPPRGRDSLNGGFIHGYPWIEVLMEVLMEV